jgi:hypothetical protein
VELNSDFENATLQDLALESYSFSDDVYSLLLKPLI